MEDKSEVEFELEFDNGFVCSFEPDFRLQKNTADHSSVSWGLPSSRDAINVGVLCEEFSTESSADSTIFSSANVRLLP